MSLKKLIIAAVSCAVWCFATASHAKAQIPVAEIIKEGVKKVIKAVDLEVQRLQNKTVALQSAQKVMENTMSKLHLDEITGWVQKQKDLYAGFYDELWQVKSAITYYHRIKEIYAKQSALVKEYRQAWNLLRADPHFDAGELRYMADVYTGILNETVQHVNQLLNVVQAFTTRMSDADRMAVINRVGHQVDENYDDLHRFNNQNALLSLARAKDGKDAALVKWMYGL